MIYFGQHLIKFSLANNIKKFSLVGNKRWSSQSVSKVYDVAVIGGGPGGYVAAIKAAQLGLNTICIEKRDKLGGTCLNVGCIPSKALLNISHKYHEAKTQFKKMGIIGGDFKVDFNGMQVQKEKCMKGLQTGIEGLFKMNKVDYKKGIAHFTDPTNLSVQLNDGSKIDVKSKNFIIATGSESSMLPNSNIKPDEEHILTSTGALALKEIPKKLVVVGGGAIGLELGSVYSRLGSEVIVLEFLNRIIPSMDSDISAAFKKILEKQGIKFMLESKLIQADVANNSIKIKVASVKDNKETALECDKLLLAVGRRPVTETIGLDAIQVQTNKMGFIPTDSSYRVQGHSHIYAIGDCIEGPMLAHKAEEEGVAVAEIISGKKGHVNYGTIPAVVYTHPEVGSVGYTEDLLKKEKKEYKKGIFSFAANSRARTNDDFDGMVKILADKQTDKIIGCSIIGPSAGELIQQIVIAMELGATSESIGRTCFSHPALSEAVKEACLATFDRPIHGSR